MLERNIKEILKQKPFNYDEEKYTSMGANFHVKLLKENDVVIKRLIRCGMNGEKGFKTIKSTMKTTLAVRKQFFGDGLVEGTTKANKFLDKYHKTKAQVEEKLKKLELNTNRFDENLDAHLNVALEEAKSISTPKFAALCQNLNTLGADSVKLLEAIYKCTDNAIDVSSTSSAEYAKKVLTLVNEWKEKITQVVENGKIVDPKVITAPLQEAKKVATLWAEVKVGVSATNPVSTYRIEVYNEDTDLLGAVIKDIVSDGGIMDGCDELKSIRNSNNTILDEICESLRKASADRFKSNISEEDRETLRALHEKFSTKSLLLNKAVGGNYFKSRISGESALTDFILIERHNISRIEDSVSFGSCDQNIIKGLVQQTQACFDAWSKTKAQGWIKDIKIDGVSNMEVRGRLMSLIDSTVRDMGELVDSSQELEGEDNEKVLSFAATICERLGAVKSTLICKGFADTQENAEQAEKIREQIGNIRAKMFAISANEKSIEVLLRGLDNEVQKFYLTTAEKGNAAKKIGLREYGDDDLVCAVKVTNWLNESSSFIKNLKSIMRDRPVVPKLKVIKLSEDQEYTSLLQQISEAETGAINAQTDEEADSYMIQLEALEELKEARVKEIAALNEELREEYVQIKEGRKTGYERMLERLESIYKQFTGRTLVTYKKRAEILERSGIGSFDDIFNQLSEARADGDTTAILMVEGKLMKIINEYKESRQALEKAEGIISRESEQEKAKAEAEKARFDKALRDRTGAGLTTSDSEEKEKQARKERLAAIRAQRGMATDVSAPDKKPENTVAIQADAQKDAFADLRIKERN